MYISYANFSHFINLRTDYIAGSYTQQLPQQQNMMYTNPQMMQQGVYINSILWAVAVSLSSHVNVSYIIAVVLSL